MEQHLRKPKAAKKILSDIRKTLRKGPGQKLPAVQQWPEWESPDPKFLFEIFEKMIPFVKFVDPRVVEAVVKDNQKNELFFIDLLEKNGISSERFLWRGSPCVFPGVKEGMQIPKHIWSFMFLGRAAEVDTPAKFALTHLIDYSAYNHRRFVDEVVGRSGKYNGIPGLFSSIANSCYVPSSSLMPDFQVDLRRMFQHRARDLYKNVCEILPPGYDLAPPPVLYGIFANKWPPVVGGTKNLGAFFKFRREEVENNLIVIKPAA